MKKKIVFVILLNLLFLTACNGLKTQADYSSELVSYMISEPANYYGEGQYYHEIQKIEHAIFEGQYQIDASGEIKDNSIGNTSADYTFNYEFLVTDQSVIQKLNNNRLNDSDFQVVEILSLPLEMGHTWYFDAVMFNNKTTKMTAEIVYISEALDEIKVKYTAKDYTEFRVFKKGLGVTDFTKEIAYKNVKAISGFHLQKDGELDRADFSEAEVTVIQNEADAFTDIAEQETTLAEHDLILGFNQNYEKKIKLEEHQLSDYVMPESPAREKIDQLKAVDVGTFHFIQFKAKTRKTIGEAVIIEVVEQYDIGEGQSIVNTITYTLKPYGDRLMIYNFE
ncbi:hypothetical protein [Fusibacter ferrireducens]|uniref:Lipoprotein n=1 Tax=Fusibacter ferrireducens TaxID=2785058 RepID=A0ABR9ZWE4_9FIRM|nr:hypothetical protein [Fusibacter ferrireducens]MBF4694792.1 hypothetical protein [Fusibacter ferrireducens]